MRRLRPDTVNRAAGIAVCVVLAINVLVSCVTSQLAPFAPDPSTWHITPIAVSGKIRYITPLESTVLKLSPYMLPLTFLAIVLLGRQKRPS